MSPILYVLIDLLFLCYSHCLTKWWMDEWIVILYRLRILSLASTFYKNKTIVERRFKKLRSQTVTMTDRMVVYFFLRHSVYKYDIPLRYYYTVFLKKEAVWWLIITLANVEQFSKFFHRVIRENILYVTMQWFPHHLQYVATLPCESLKSKNVTEFARWT